MKESLFVMTPSTAFSQEDNISDLSTKTNSNLLSSNLTLAEDFKKVMKNVISKVVSEMLSQVDEPYANQELGLQIHFPNGWHGTLIKPADTLVISPPEINITRYFVDTAERGLYSMVNSIPLSENITSQNILRTSMNSMFNQVFESLGQLKPTISVSGIDKDAIKSFQNLSGIQPPTKSLSSIWYDYALSIMNQIMSNVTASTNPFVRNAIKSVNYSQINGIPVEVVASETAVQQSGKTFNTLGYLFLTPSNIINIEYSGDKDSYKKHLSEFENSVKTVILNNAIPINEENIKQFVK